FAALHELDVCLRESRRTADVNEGPAVTLLQRLRRDPQCILERSRVNGHRDRQAWPQIRGRIFERHLALEAPLPRRSERAAQILYVASILVPREGDHSDIHFLGLREVAAIELADFR